MTISILGAGNVGATLGQRFASLGHEIHFGVREPGSDKNRTTVERIHADTGTQVSASTVAEAVEGADLVVLATPWETTEEALKSVPDWKGKIIADCTNPLEYRDGGFHLTTGFSTSGAEQVAEWAAGARVVKAWNQTGFPNMANPVYGDHKNVLFVCGDDEAARKTVHELAEAIGFDVIDAGGLSIARFLEPLATLWIHLAFTTPLGKDFAFGLLRR